MSWLSGSGSDRSMHITARVALLVSLLVIVSSGVAANDIVSESETITLGDTTSVEVDITYTEMDSDQISMLVPESHDPRDIRALDGNGALDCSFDEVNNEILCDSRQQAGAYNITVRYTTPDPSRQENGYRSLEHVQRVLVPMERYQLRVVLPEGHGTVSDEEIEPIVPADARTGSEGRRISISWENTNLSLGDTLRFRVRYQDLSVFGGILSDNPPLVIGILLVLVAVILSVYIRRQKGEGDTIASVLPVLKEDEQEVLKFIIRQGGECGQREVVESLDYSKAKVSRLVKDLEERNLVDKVKEGRRNRLKLTKDVGDIDIGGE